jgi:energy-converting hydrogenase Eha subunit C
MDPRKKQYLHIALMAIAIICSVASIEQLFIQGATRWTAAFNVLSIILILMAFKTRPVRPS